MSEVVLIVDRDDKPVEVMDAVTAHQGDGKLHRAISVMLHNGEGLVLIQKRSGLASLWPGIWSTSVSAHPGEHEDYIQTALRALKDDLGIDIKEKRLKILYKFLYKAKYSTGDELPGFGRGGLAEHELDTVIVGKYLGEASMNQTRVADCKWIHWDELKEDIERHPDHYTPWLKLMVDNGKLDKVIG